MNNLDTQQLSKLKNFGPDRAWMRRTRTNLTHFARAHDQEAYSSLPIFSLRLAVSLSLFILLLISTTVLVQASSARPGDFIYPIKRAIEKTHVIVTANLDAKRKLLQNQINTRLQELAHTVATGDLKNQDLAAKETKDTLTSAVSADGDQVNETITKASGAVADLAETAQTEPEKQKLNDLKKSIDQMHPLVEGVSTTSAEVKTPAPELTPTPAPALTQTPQASATPRPDNPSSGQDRTPPDKPNIPTPPKTPPSIPQAPQAPQAPGSPPSP